MKKIFTLPITILFFIFSIWTFSEAQDQAISITSAKKARDLTEGLPGEKTIPALTTKPVATGWRGPARDGIFPEKNLLKEWPAGGPALLWKYDGLGAGFASAAVTDERVYTIGTTDSTSFVFCFDLQGKLLWKKALGPEWIKNFPGSRSTPTIYEGLGYYINGHGDLYCFDAVGGDTRWKRELLKECGGENRNWGFVDNLIVDEDRLYCTPSGKKQNMVALNRHTGEMIWECPGNAESSAYSTPVLFEIDGKKLLVNQPGKAYIAINPDNGKLLWKYEKQEEHASSHRTPIYRDGYLLGLDDENTGSVMLKIVPDGSRAEVAWRNADLFSVQGEAVVLGERIYGPGNRSKLVCADWKTGKTLFTQTFGGGIFVLIAADNLLYSYDMNGNLNLLRPLDDRLEVVGSGRVTGGTNEHFSHPVIQNGRLYVRHENSLFVYDISRKS